MPAKKKTPAKKKAPPVAAAPACSPRQLAEKIVIGLLTVNLGGGRLEKGKRLEIRTRFGKVFKGREQESVLGGWCEHAAVDEITRIIEEND